MLERSFVLPNHDFKSPNPKIPWKEWNLKIPPMQRPFPRGKKYVSVNNFGFGGTNGHVVLETAPFREKEELTEKELDKQPKLIVFSANDKTSLQAILKNSVIYLERRPEVFEGALMRNIAYTLGQRRSLLPWRATMHARESLS
uniref:Polyketide synthase n=1 Tax=Penicillium citreonigrum TaxID=69768 RepID=W6A2E3_9EURO|nr:polyketide synthase [Penicillium citreonigrum]